MTPSPQGTPPSEVCPSRVEDQTLLEAARAALQRSYSPRSGFRVGVALATADGHVVPGTNVENASLSLTICAERVAAAGAVAQGAGRPLRLVLVSDAAQPILPCGACCQFLSELAPDLSLLSVGGDGRRRETTLAELLPRPFRPASTSDGAARP